MCCKRELYHPFPPLAIIDEALLYHPFPPLAIIDEALLCHLQGGDAWLLRHLQ